LALSKNITEYEDCREHLDRALSSQRGIRINMPSSGGAIHLRQRMYKLRQLEKLKSLEIYEMGDSRRNKSAYDNLTITVVGDSVEVRHAEPLTIEDL
jgi:hypothetical protein